MRPIYSTLTTSNSTNKPPVQKPSVVGSGAMKDPPSGRAGTATTAQSVFRKSGVSTGGSAPTTVPPTAPLRPFNAGNISAIRPTAEVIAAANPTTNIGKADDSFEQENLNPMQRWKRAVERHNQKLGIVSDSNQPAAELSTVSQRAHSNAPAPPSRAAPEPPKRNVRSRWPPGNDDEARPKAATGSDADLNAASAPKDAPTGHVFGGGKGEEMFRRRFQTIEASSEPEPRGSQWKSPIAPQTTSSESERVPVLAPGQVSSNVGPFIRKFQAFAADPTSGAPSIQTASLVAPAPADSVSGPTAHTAPVPSVHQQGAVRAAPMVARATMTAPASGGIAPSNAQPTLAAAPAHAVIGSAASASAAVPEPDAAATNDLQEPPQNSQNQPSMSEQPSALPGQAATEDRPGAAPDKVHRDADAIKSQNASHMSNGHRTPLQVAQIRSELEEARREHRLLLKKLTGIERERDSVRAERAQLQHERAALARDRDALVARVMRLRQLIKQQQSFEEPAQRPKEAHATAGTLRRMQNRATCSDDELSRPRSRRQQLPRSTSNRHRRSRRDHRPLNESLREVGVRLGRWWRKLFIAPRLIDDDTAAFSADGADFDDDGEDEDTYSMPDIRRRPRRQPAIGAGRMHPQRLRQARRSRDRAHRSLPAAARNPTAARGTAVAMGTRGAATVEHEAPHRRHASHRLAGTDAYTLPSTRMDAGSRDETDDLCEDSAEEGEQLPKTALFELEQQLRSLVHRLQAMDTVLVGEDEALPDGEAPAETVTAPVGAGRGAKTTTAGRTESSDMATDGPHVMRRQNPYVRSGMRGISRPMQRAVSNTGGHRAAARPATTTLAGRLAKSPRRSTREMRRSVAQALQARPRLAAPEALLSDTASVESDDVGDRYLVGDSFELETADSIRNREASQGDSLLYPNADW